MNNIEKSRVTEIVALHQEIKGLLKMSVEKAMQIGKLLDEQKDGCDHGEFTPWVEANLPFTHMTATKYMKLYRNRRLVRRSLKSKPDLLLTEAYELIQKPKTVKSRAVSDDFQKAEKLVENIEKNAKRLSRNVIDLRDLHNKKEGVELRGLKSYSAAEALKDLVTDINVLEQKANDEDSADQKVHKELSEDPVLRKLEKTFDDIDKHATTLRNKILSFRMQIEDLNITQVQGAKAFITLTSILQLRKEIDNFLNVKQTKQIKRTD